MRSVHRSEIIDYKTYEETREALQEKVFAVKARRRIHLGEYFTFLFENALTIRYQIQEMMRIERIVRESGIHHELETFNGILGGQGELGCTMLIEINDSQLRDVMLRRWLELPEHIYAVLPDGSKAKARCDKAQQGEERLSAVQYLKFAVNGIAPVAIGIDLPGTEVELNLTEDQRAALQEDLAS